MLNRERCLLENWSSKGDVIGGLIREGVLLEREVLLERGGGA